MRHNENEDVYLQFQFHKGTIKACDTRPTSPAPQFQFHKGTIKAIQDLLLHLHRSEHFNSIKVQLKPMLCKPPADFSVNFNSIKVQLKLLRFMVGVGVRQFQFHKGTIKAP